MNTHSSIAISDGAAPTTTLIVVDGGTISGPLGEFCALSGQAIQVQRTLAEDIYSGQLNAITDGVVIIDSNYSDPTLILQQLTKRQFSLPSFVILQPYEVRKAVEFMRVGAAGIITEANKPSMLLNDLATQLVTISRESLARNLLLACRAA